ncbi:MAG: CapA family protein [Anaerolineae bacterium]|nr:CapA family protein [Anaerolineae bacterium]
MRRSKIFTRLLTIALLLSACRTQTAAPVPLPTSAQPVLPTDAAAPQIEPVSTPTPIIPTPEPARYWVQPGIPESLVGQITPLFAAAGLTEAASAEEAILRVMADPGPEAALTTEWVYALAAPFPTVPDNISWAAFETYWLTGDSSGLPDFGVTSPPFVLRSGEIALLTEIIGPPAGGLPIQTSYDDINMLTEFAWNVRPAISILPFDQLTPQWKVLTVDGASPLDKSLDTSTYPLSVRFGILAADPRGEQIAAGLASQNAWAVTNRDPSKMTVIVMTGVTALARATASMMELKGYDYPAQAILPFFADADITHTSNEVAFAPNCPPPQWEGDPLFCSSINYLSLLKLIGLDVVELTGNHVNDWGRDNLSYTIGVYEQNGIAYYGGGRDLEDAASARIILAPDGTRIAFIGCNAAGPTLAFANEELPGSAPCGDWLDITSRIQQIKANDQADIVIATLQYWERQRYNVDEQQIADFSALAAAGADIVSGSQAHQPQGFNFAGESFIHFGVGNLFFDQMQTLGYRQMFADKHILYEGRHISTILFTGLMEDYSQPNPMTPEDRAAFLQLIFDESVW